MWLHFVISVLLFKHDSQLFFQLDFQTFDSSARVFKVFSTRTGKIAIDLKKEKCLSYGAFSYSARKPVCRAGKTRVPAVTAKARAPLLSVFLRVLLFSPLLRNQHLQLIWIPLTTKYSDDFFLRRLDEILFGRL